MAYLGVPPQSGFITTAKQRITSSTNNYVDLDHSISSLADVIVWVNFVKQDSTNLSLTTSSRITLGATLVASDIVEIAYLGKAVATQTPSSGTVTNDMLSGSIANSKLATDPLNASNLASGTVPTARLGSGTASSSTFLRGDSTFAEAGGDNKPYFFVGTATTENFADATTTVVPFSSEVIDEGGCYNNTNSSVTLNGLTAPAYSFTPNVAGKYFIATTMQTYHSGGNMSNSIAMLSKNGSQFIGTSQNFGISGQYVNSLTAYGIVDLNGTGDYVQGQVYIDISSGTPQLLGGNNRNTLQGFKLI